MRSISIRYWLALLALVAIQYPTPAYGEDEAKEPKVYFEKECLALFSAANASTQISENETKVEEKKGLIVSYDELVVTETKDGSVQTFIQVRNCRDVRAPGHL